MRYYRNLTCLVHMCLLQAHETLLELGRNEEQFLAKKKVFYHVYIITEHTQR